MYYGHIWLCNLQMFYRYWHNNINFITNVIIRQFSGLIQIILIWYDQPHTLPDICVRRPTGWLGRVLAEHRYREQQKRGSVSKQEYFYFIKFPFEVTCRYSKSLFIIGIPLVQKESCDQKMLLIKCFNDVFILL